MNDYPIETVDLTKENAGCIILLRQADVGWEYSIPHFEGWRKANNREHALEFAIEDAVSTGEAHRWRVTGSPQPPKEVQVQWTADQIATLQSIREQQSFFGRLARFFRRGSAK